VLREICHDAAATLKKRGMASQFGLCQETIHAVRARIAVRLSQ
jgi:hypothetical protein